MPVTPSQLDKFISAISRQIESGKISLDDIPDIVAAHTKKVTDKALSSEIRKIQEESE